MSDPYDPTDEFREIDEEMARLEEEGKTDTVRYKALKRKRDKPPSSMGGFGSTVQKIGQQADDKLRRENWQERRDQYDAEEGTDE